MTQSKPERIRWDTLWADGRAEEALVELLSNHHHTMMYPEIAQAISRDTGIEITTQQLLGYIDKHENRLRNAGCNLERPRGRVRIRSSHELHNVPEGGNGGISENGPWKQEKHPKEPTPYSELKEGKCCFPVKKVNGELLVCGDSVRAPREPYCSDCAEISYEPAAEKDTKKGKKPPIHKRPRGKFIVGVIPP